MTDNRTTELTATDRLRAILDERGVEWWPMRNGEYYEDRDTEFVVNGTKHTAHAWGKGLQVDMLTPEQAIAATLGSEREKALEELVRDMWFWGYEGHMDSKSQDWQMKHIDGVLDRMNQLGIEVD